MKKPVVLAALALALLAARADQFVRVDDAWVRTTVGEQKTTAAYMSLISPKGASLFAVTSPVASAVEVHEMKMDGDVMRMRSLQTLELPAGKKVELKPNSYHLMLMGLKHRIKAGDVIPISLEFRDDTGLPQTVQVRATAR